MNRPEFLAELARADESQGATPELESALLQAFQRRRQAIWTRGAAGWSALAAAMVLVWIAIQPPVKQHVKAVVVPPVVTELPAAPAPSVIVAAGPLRPKPVRAPVKREIMTNFIPVMVDPDPFERGRLVRVKLPRSALTAFGLQLNEDRSDERIQADVLVGEDGLARAIRFVK